jgi:hypothetical protein
VSRAAALGVASALWALVVAGAFVALEPGATLRSAPLLAGMGGLAAAGTAALACTGAGAALLARLWPRTLEDPLGWLRALGLGLVIWGLLSLPAAALLGVRPWVGVALLALLMCGWLLRPPLAAPRLSRGELSWGLLFLVPALLTLLSPITDSDELYYHLALPARMLDEGALLGGPWMANGSRPLALHLPWTWLLGLGGAQAPRALHLLLGAAVLLMLRRRAGAWWGPTAGLVAPLLLLGSTSFLQDLGLAYADLPAALLLLLAVDAALASHLPLVALYCGGALAVKYTAVFGALPLFVWLGLGALRREDQRGRALLHLLLAGLGTLALVAPWWLRNLLEGLHPLFPFAGWELAGDFVFQFREKYGLGHGLVDTLLLPWNLVVHANPESNVFMGRLNPAFLALLPAALVAAWRDRRAASLLLVCGLGLLLWSLGSQWLRYLLPVLVLAALLASAGAALLPRWAGLLVGLVWLAGLPANLGPVLATAGDQARVALGLEPRESYLERQTSAWPALHWLNHHSPRDAKVALLFSWQAALLERPWVLGSVEDHVPTRHHLALHGEDSLAVLKRNGVTHVLVSRIAFVHKSYPFMDRARFEELFTAPEEQLRDLLDAQATLMFEHRRHAVYRLD